MSIVKVDYGEMEGGVEMLCGKDEYISGSTTNSFTNGQSITFPKDVVVMFNCMDYDYVHESSSVGMSIYGIAKEKCAYIGSASTANKNVSDYDYLLYMRGGNPTTTLAITFS